MQIYLTEMANQWRIAVVTCLMLSILMEEAKPVLSQATGKSRIGKRVTALENRVKALEETCMNKCKR